MRQNLGYMTLQLFMIYHRKKYSKHIVTTSYNC